MNIRYAENATVNQGSKLKSLIEARRLEKQLDRPVPLNTRANRRAADRAFARVQRKGKKKYMQRALLEQRVVADLAHQFNIIDGHIAARPDVVERVRNSVADKVRMLGEQDGARYEKEWRAAAEAYLAEHPDVDIEDMYTEDFGIRDVISEDQAYSQLRGMAKTAVIPQSTSARAKARRQAKADAEHASLAPRALTGHPALG